MPSARLMQHFMSVPCDAIVLVGEPVLADSVVGPGPRVTRIEIARVMDAVRLGGALTTQRLGHGVLSAAPVILEGAGSGIALAEAPAPLPSRHTLHKARVRLDAFATLRHRSLWQRESRRVFR